MCVCVVVVASHLFSLSLSLFFLLRCNPCLVPIYQHTNKQGRLHRDIGSFGLQGGRRVTMSRQVDVSFTDVKNALFPLIASHLEDVLNQNPQ